MNELFRVVTSVEHCVFHSSIVFNLSKGLTLKSPVNNLPDKA
ncbi:hypothetical protein GMES_0574 [Paraglaciecola mesophila KMM 241]|uniref:Uncharacterized protein n=1 Tax=Paraglaciecola mesophila KMM 241 TaxID=1128912 RepID=K6ZHN0_9ALTE|nr:hypothetical protein GMES_0574 [Paraglaciecola mesophila KMM 241]